MASQALSAQQQAISTIGNNISNVNTPGYARQRANLVTSDIITQSNGDVGTGVTVADVESLRSTLLSGIDGGWGRHLVHVTDVTAEVGSRSTVLHYEEPAITTEIMAVVGSVVSGDCTHCDVGRCSVVRMWLNRPNVGS